MKELAGKRALVTGASSGLGTDFARILAENGCHLILVARRQERLEVLKQELENQHSVHADVIVMDLAQENAGQLLYEKATAIGEVDVLINNAGVGLYGEFVDAPWEREKNMLMLNIVNLTHLTKLFVKDMVSRNSGYILNVASVGAYQPTPLYGTYSAAKAFVLNFTEALNYELKGTNVKVTAVSPGVTRSEFQQTAGQSQSTWYQKWVEMPSYPVCKAGIKAMVKGRPSLITGWLNAITIFTNRLAPRRMTAMTASFLMKGG